VQPRAHQGHKSDAADAWALAEQLRVRAKGVYVFKPTRQYRPLREAVRTYGVAVKDLTRAKNRFRSLLRARGVANFDSSIYEPELQSFEGKSPIASWLVSRRTKAPIAG
jgi:hypothetical protein